MSDGEQPGAPDQAVLFMTHFVDAPLLEAFAKVQRELAGSAHVILLFNAADGTALPEAAAHLPHHLTNREALARLPFPRAREGFGPETTDLPFHHFAMTRPGYRHYWLMEYDVRFSGNWRTLFDAFAASPADLLCTNLFRRAGNPEWHRRYPPCPPEGVTVTEDDLIRGFFPFYRLSRRGVDVLQAAFAEGWEGHYEAIVPVILARAGCIIEDFGGAGEFVAPGNRNRFYLSAQRTLSMSPGTFVYRPVFTRPGKRADTLWHPVKPGHRFTGDSVRSRVLRLVYRLLLPLMLLKNRR
ncbi:MAG: DUF3405 domain-containing protein [Alphaproteobacteria bacterium]|nr:DUF3405 domain-containing protein [Alphaproteobacteria bacterium]